MNTYHLYPLVGRDLVDVLLKPCMYYKVAFFYHFQLQVLTLETIKGELFIFSIRRTCKTWYLKTNYYKAPLQFIQKVGSLSDKEPIACFMVASSASGGATLQAFNTLRRVFPFSKNIYSGGRLFELPACNSNWLGVTTYID